MQASQRHSKSGNTSAKVSVDGSYTLGVSEDFKQQLHHLNARLEAVDCGAVDKALLLDPEASAWLDIVQKLCVRYESVIESLADISFQSFMRFHP